MKMSKSILIIAVFSIGLYGCKETDPHAGHDHGAGGHEDHASHGGHAHDLSITSWSKHTEAYIKYKPLVAGAEGKFTVNVTLLEGYLPYEDELTYEMLVEGKSMKYGTAELKSAGTYTHSDVLPEGEIEIKYGVKTADNVDYVVVTGITCFNNKEAAEHDAHENGHENPNAIEYDKTQAWVTEFSSVFAVRDTIYNVIKAGGHIMGSVGDEKTVSATAAGIIVYSSDLVIGKPIKKGSRLFTIVGGGIADHNLEAHFLKAKSELEKATSNYERKQSLYDAEAVSKADLEEAKLEFELARTDYNSVSAGYSKGGKSIKANSSGYVKVLFKTEGDYVAVGEQLAIVSKNEKLMLEAHVGQAEQENLPAIVSANFKLNNKMFSIKDFHGKLISYGRSVSKEDPKIPVYFELANQGNLMVGSFTEVFIQTGPVKIAVVIPMDALLEDYGHYSVVVQTSGETYEIRAVELGVSDGVRVEVVSGVKDGERVIVDGAYQVKMAEMSGKIPAHIH
ncbi:MAG: cobalt-zinc-cadmium efflux system membrane fusion protein [Parvicellaceae bacterium]|jgi:cobalt-zinc-cadmium efflux system membrane fusion protein